MDAPTGPIAPEDLLAELIIRVSKTDQVTVTGPLGNEMLCFKMLALGMNRLTDHFVMLRNQAAQAATLQKTVQKLENGHPVDRARGRWGLRG